MNIDLILLVVWFFLPVNLITPQNFIMLPWIFYRRSDNRKLLSASMWWITVCCDLFISSHIMHFSWHRFLHINNSMWEVSFSAVTTEGKYIGGTFMYPFSSANLCQGLCIMYFLFGKTGLSFLDCDSLELIANSNALARHSCWHKCDRSTHSTPVQMLECLLMFDLSWQCLLLQEF